MSSSGISTFSARREPRRRGAVHEREHDRQTERDEHPRERPQRVVRQTRRIGRDRRRRVTRARTDAVTDEPEPQQPVQHDEDRRAHQQVDEPQPRAAQHAARRERLADRHDASPPHRHSWHEPARRRAPGRSPHSGGESRSPVCAIDLTRRGHTIRRRPEGAAIGEHLHVTRRSVPRSCERTYQRPSGELAQPARRASTPTSFVHGN